VIKFITWTSVRPGIIHLMTHDFVKKIESKYAIIVEVLFEPVACAIVDVFQKKQSKEKNNSGKNIFSTKSQVDYEKYKKEGEKISKGRKRKVLSKSNKCFFLKLLTIPERTKFRQERIRNSTFRENLKIKLTLQTYKKDK
jgi:hypothetical protein